MKKKAAAKVAKKFDMNSAFFMAREERSPRWHVVDAKDKVLGRLATDIANKLRGKDKVVFTPHTDAGDYVVVINAELVKLTKDKMTTKIYQSYSGWIGGLKELTAEQVMKKDPTRIITHAVEGMLAKSRLNRQVLKKLKVYAGSEHPHKAHVAK